MAKLPNRQTSGQRMFFLAGASCVIYPCLNVAVCWSSVGPICWFRRKNPSGHHRNAARDSKGPVMLYLCPFVAWPHTSARALVPGRKKPLNLTKKSGEKKPGFLYIVDMAVIAQISWLRSLYQFISSLYQFLTIFTDSP